MTLNPHLSFNGNCEEAFQFYERCLGAKIQGLFTYGSSPMAEQTPPEWRAKLMHATLAVGNNILYGADVRPDQYHPPSGFHLAVNVSDPKEAERVFQSLSEGGTVRMPLQKTFWSAAFGMVVDRFGVSWEINCEQPQ